MRRLIAAAVLLCVATLCASTAAAGKKWKKDYPEEHPMPRNEETGKYEYQEIVKLEGVDADTVYSRARLWVADAYVSAQDVVQLEDEKAGRLVVKGAFHVWVPWFAPAVNKAPDYNQSFHTLRIEAKEGRYRYIMTDFRLSGLGIEEWEDSKFARRHRSEVAVNAQAIIESLKVAMELEADEDW